MGTFLTIVGVIALIFFGKFIYDSFLTDNTEKEWTEYKRDNPIEAKRVEKASGLDISGRPQPRKSDKDASLARMARNMGCSRQEVRQRHIEFLRKENMSDAILERFISDLKSKKNEEALIYDIDPEDTGASFLYKWTNEYLNQKKSYQGASASTTLAEKYIEENDELKKALDKGSLSEFMNTNPDIVGDFLTELAAGGRSAQSLLDRAVDAAIRDEQFEKAIKLATEGLELKDEKVSPFLYNIRAESNMKVGNYVASLHDYNEAVDLLEKTSPGNSSLIDFLKGRSWIHKKLGNTNEFNGDMERIRILAMFDDIDDDLPF